MRTTFTKLSPFFARRVLLDDGDIEHCWRVFAVALCGGQLEVFGRATLVLLRADELAVRDFVRISLNLVNSSGWDTSTHVADTLVRIGAAAARSALVELRDTGAPDESAWAAKILGLIASRLSCQTLSEEQRRWAIIDASLAADPASVPALLSLLRRDTYANRRHIARALGNIGGPDAESALLELLRSEEGLLLGDAARALGRLGVTSATDRLRELLDHELDWVRSGAREALGRLGGGA
jgi:HEAT repeat protein